ncbi:MAG TPA: hypothetical protein VFN55_17590 [Solirubrobacteraceae bacterium]|nr:hypothetical protein [Solirubrobacteraceae bacterium]
MSEPIHLHPTAALAERVLLPGDPGRALRLAEALLDTPKMFNHHRGLWGYTGVAADGAPLTIQSTGMGGPSTAIVVAELYDLGARRMVRVGTCGALHPALVLGEPLVVTEAIVADGTSAALGASGRVSPDPELLERLTEAAGGGTARGTVVSTDLFYDGRAGEEHAWREEGARAVEMEASTLFTLGRRRGFAAAALLLVSDLLIPQRRRIAEDDLLSAERRLGAIATTALTRAG